MTAIPRRRFRFAAALLFLPVGFAPPLAAQKADPSFYAGMRWRLIGPYRAGRVTAVAGVPGDPGVYYMGTPGGGVWKTTDGGTVWTPIFDAEHVASIGALAVSPSDPRVVYVATGEQTEGDGVYKSQDGGATWSHLGLADTRIIDALVVDPHDPDIVLVGAMGKTAPGRARGVYKSTDGGKTWRQVLFKDDRTGIADLALDPSNPRIVYASLLVSAFVPGRRPQPGPDAWLYRSDDEGSTWQPVAGRGLPSGRWGRTGIAVAPGTGQPRLYAILAQGLFRSDDGGDSWRQTTRDPRVVGSGYFSRVFIDPANPDVVYVAQTSLYRSTDGGSHFIAFKGAPGGDDYHVMWSDPRNPNRMILGVDQGATISLDGGHSWTPWYNQPTGQFYHVTTGGGFTYFVYGQQQDSGSAAVRSRSDFGEIRSSDWFSPGGYEFGYIAADPLDPDLDYAGGQAGTVVRLDRRTGQLTFLYVHGPEVRTSANAPLVFSPLDPHALFFAAQFVVETTDGGTNWKKISPDLTLRPSSAGASAPAGRGAVITTLAPSPAAQAEIWAGTSNGLFQLTRDGGASWQNVTPRGLSPRDLVSIIEASHFDAGTAYVALDRTGDSRPYFYRTRDFGQTWTKVDRGLPDFGIARVVREDPARRGLLYAGTETGVFVSFDDGDHWQSLQLNLPTASVRDLAVHDNDLVAATFGRALWILDDLTPLRQLDAARSSGGVYLYEPETALRIRWDRTTDTPLPPEVPAGENPPDGAILDYYLRSAPAGLISLEIYDAHGGLVHRYSSVPAPPEPVPANVPSYWFAPPVALPKRAGMNRFVWNLRYPHPDALPSALSSEPGGDYFVYEDTFHSVLGKTPRHYPFGPQVLPGTYEIVLKVGSRSFRRSLVVKMDPRIAASQTDLEAQLATEQETSSAMAVSARAYRQVMALLSSLADRQHALAPNPQMQSARAAADRFAEKLRALAEGTPRNPGFGTLNHLLAEGMGFVESGDGRPTVSVLDTAAHVCAALDTTLAAWKQLASQDLPALNDMLSKNGLQTLTPPSALPSSPACAKSP